MEMILDTVDQHKANLQAAQDKLKTGFASALNTARVAMQEFEEEIAAHEAALTTGLSASLSHLEGSLRSFLGGLKPEAVSTAPAIPPAPQLNVPPQGDDDGGSPGNGS
jgi:hypothetical protein